MGKVKMEDLHSLLDLANEAIFKTSLRICCSIHSFGKQYGYFMVCVQLYEEIGEHELKTVFSKDFYVGNGVLAEDEEYVQNYVKCREKLKQLIAEGNENV